MSLWSRIERRLGDLAGELILDEYRDQLNQARALLEADDPRAAIDVVEALLRDRPEHGQALILLGAARLETGELDAAHDAFARALQIRSGDPEALVGLGEALYGLGRSEEAVSALGRAVAEAAGDRAVLAEAYRTLGLAWRELGDLDKAVRELRKAVAEAPGDDLARAALGEALLADGADPDEARRHLDKASGGEAPPPIAAVALGQLALADGTPALAAQCFARARSAVEPDPSPPGRRMLLAALIGLGDAALAERDAAGAHGSYLEALAIDPRRAETHARLAAAHRAIGNHDAALASYDRALALATSPRRPSRPHSTPRSPPATPAARSATPTTCSAPSPITRARWSPAPWPWSTPASPTPPAACSARRWPRPAAAIPKPTSRWPGSSWPAPPTIPAPPAAPPTPPATRSAPTRTTSAPDASWSTPGPARSAPTCRPTPTSARSPACSSGSPGSRRDLAGLVGDVSRATADLDQPLLVTVMGEFSSGKSTFVNAFIGHDVAPTGITPTTATINVVKYGAERGGRIVTRDGAVVPVAWDTLFSHLRALTPEAAAAVDRVEILLPLPSLERINIVDTPGLNSILPEHEATARAFIGRADAVVWVFTAGQGGKKSERAALEKIRGRGPPRPRRPQQARPAERRRGRRGRRPHRGHPR